MTGGHKTYSDNCFIIYKSNHYATQLKLTVSYASVQLEETI